MTKFKFVYAKELINRLIFRLCCLLLFWIFSMLITRNLFFAMFFFAWFGLAACIVFKLYHNLLWQYRITSDGVESRKLKFKWEEITEYDVIFEQTRDSYLRLVSYPPMICIGKVRNGGFFAQNSKECVMIPITQENLQMIQLYCKVENAVIKEILDQYLGYPEYIPRSSWWN